MKFFTYGYMICCLAGAFLALSSAVANDEAIDSAAPGRGFTRLFDGKTFAGWEGETKQTFRIEQGAIVGGSLEARVPRNEFLCTTKEYGDFDLRLKAKLIGQGKNAGVQFRSSRKPNHFEVIGYQCDMGQMGAGAKARPIWGSLYDESRRRKFLAEGAAEQVRSRLKQGDWNLLRIRCEGTRVRIWVNGLQTVDYTEPDKKIARRGVIALQIHGGLPAEAWYKDIFIKELDGKP